MPGWTEKITFPGSHGAQLAAGLEWPAAAPKGFVLFAHCFTCSKESRAAKKISQALAAMGFAVLRFDFTGLGASEGDFANTNFTSNIEDLLAAADYLRDHHRAPAILIGHSLGGAAVLAAAGRVPEARAVVTIGAPCDPSHVSHLFAGSIEEIEKHGEAEVTLVGRKFRIQRQFLDDIAEHKTAVAIKGLGKALLVFHAPGDEIVAVENAAKIFTAAKHPKSYVSLDDADHMLSRASDGDYVASVLAAWASRYLPESEAGAPASEGWQATVDETAPAPYAQDIWAGGHRLRADEPKAYGGAGTGPSPYDLLIAALGACTTITMRMYANRKGWPVEHISARLNHHKIHANDCADCETETGTIDRIEREIEIVGDLDEAQRARLMEIADKCPVHRTLHGEVKVVTSSA